MAHCAVEAEHLVKSFGAVKAVQDISFSVQHGEIFGLLGSNGAGKTTTIRMILDLIKPDSGTIIVRQRGTRIDCGFVAVQSSMMITEQELGGRPLGVLDIMGNAVRAFLDCPWVRELDLRVTARRDMGKRFQEWMEGIHVGGLDVSGDSCGSRSRRTVPVIHSKTSLSGLESYLAPIGATVGSARPVVLTTVEDLGVALSAARKVASH